MENDDFCLLKYVEILPLENNTEQFEDLKPVLLKACIVAKLVVWIKEYDIQGWSIRYLLGNPVECFIVSEWGSFNIPSDTLAYRKISTISRTRR